MTIDSIIAMLQIFVPVLMAYLIGVWVGRKTQKRKFELMLERTKFMPVYIVTAKADVYYIKYQKPEEDHKNEMNIKLHLN